MTTLEQAVQQMQLVQVFEAGEWDYEWSEFRAWRAPSGRLYWYADSGCSCYGFGDNFTAAGDFGDGDRDALERAFRAWAGENSSYCTAQEVIEGLEKLRRI